MSVNESVILLFFLMNSLSPDLVRNMNSTFFSTITPDFPADFVTFTEELFNGKLHFLSRE